VIESMPDAVRSYFFQKLLSGKIFASILPAFRAKWEVLTFPAVFARPLRFLQYVERMSLKNPVIYTVMILVALASLALGVGYWTSLYIPRHSFS